MMKIIKFILAGLLIVWGLLVAGTKLFFVGSHFPFLTIVTITALIAGLTKYKETNTILFVSGCAWMIFSFETIGFTIFFDKGNYERMLAGAIPLFLAFSLTLFTSVDYKPVDSIVKKLCLFPIFMLLGIGSYVYKPTIEEINSWYFFGEGQTYKVTFAKAPNRTFTAKMCSYELKSQVISEGLQYEGRNGYYCPETKIRVITSFSKIISAEILSFRNSEIDKRVDFSSPTYIPLDRVDGRLDILRPYTLRLWN